MNKPLFMQQCKNYLKSDNFKELSLYKDDGLFLECKNCKKSVDKKLFTKASKSFAKWLGKVIEGSRGNLIIDNE